MNTINEPQYGRKESQCFYLLSQEDDQHTFKCRSHNSLNSSIFCIWILWNCWKSFCCSSSISYKHKAIRDISWKWQLSKNNSIFHLDTIFWNKYFWHFDIWFASYEGNAGCEAGVGGWVSTIIEAGGGHFGLSRKTRAHSATLTGLYSLRLTSDTALYQYKDTHLKQIFDKILSDTYGLLLSFHSQETKAQM